MSALINITAKTVKDSFGAVIVKAIGFGILQGVVEAVVLIAYKELIDAEPEPAKETL